MILVGWYIENEDQLDAQEISRTENGIWGIAIWKSESRDQLNGFDLVSPKNKISSKGVGLPKWDKMASSQSLAWT